jgi:type I restriction enzyme S subunit
MSRWPLVPLSEVLIDRATRPDPERIVSGEIKIVSKIRFDDGSIELRAAPDSKTGLIQCEPGDLLLSGINAAKGAIGIWPETERQAIAATIHYAAYRVNERRTTSRFMWWYLRSQAFRDLIAHAIPGGIKTELKPTRLLPVPIPLPPLLEQRRIVAQLDAVSEKSDQVCRFLEEVDTDLLQAMRSIIWRSAENGGRVMLCREFMKRRRCDVAVEPETAYAFAGVYSFGRGVFRSGTKLGSQFSYRELTRLRMNEFVYPKLMAWEGALGVVPPECDGRVVSPEFPVFEIDRGIVAPVVIDTFFRDPRVWPRLQSGSTGTNLRRKRINPDQLLAMEIPIPGKADQDRLVALDALRREVVLRSAVSRQELESLIPSLLDRAFNREAADESAAPDKLRAMA